MENEHVYKYFRWRGWCKKQVGRLFGAELFYDFARQERESQEERPSKYQKKSRSEA